MSNPTDIHAAADLLISIRDLRREGLDYRDISARIKGRQLLRLRQGWYVAHEVWEGMPASSQQLLAIAAARAEAQAVPVFSHVSAATLLGLPVWSDWLRRINGRNDAQRGDPVLPRIVDITTRKNATTSSSRLLRRHCTDLPASEIDALDGLRITSRDRTLIDLARTEPFGILLVCADILLQRDFLVRRTVDAEGLEAWRQAMLHYAERHPGAPGMPAVRTVSRIADPRSESPLETMSRLRLLQLGIDVDLQTRILLPDSSSAYLDFVFLGRGIFGEADGKAKYTDKDLAKGLTAEEIVYLEKRRHELISGVSGMRGVRWGAPEVETAAHFLKRMVAFGIDVPGRPTTSYGPDTARFLGGLYGAL
ncbi:hypothetical protein G7067_06165 [Leucobacter insecticola]|uniref:Type IV toxin-antitoxin system AbiEi family antitoxin domain-containing protein n=1 Tax=Leucobacter insecticola TaxID=2714934 RepID=A0A6G8FI20_9MICO|nr:hypothetical protein [Leucobacter insecticola]QIM16100.1 hypothetical protein G7067_06165 [Leucobacter insecticola]